MGGSPKAGEIAATARYDVAINAAGGPGLRRGGGGGS